MLRKLCEFKVCKKDLIQIYILYIRSIVEQSCVVWASALTEQQKTDIERVQKISLRIILREDYRTYMNALQVTQLPSLSERRDKLMLNFALKCVKNDKTSKMFPKNSPRKTRSIEIYKIPHANTERLKKSAIPTMARLLNENANKLK